MAKEASEEGGEAGQHPLVGTVIGERYRIDALLGEGGMGAVFRATHLSLDRPVAVKVLHPRFSDDAQIGKRFDREALAVSKLDHPHCVQVIDFGTTPKGMKYLVMQYLEGKELRDITGVALPTEQVVYLGIQVLRALEHAHKRGLVHRDLKPENIFLVEDDDDNQIVKLVDFGIVKLLETTEQEKLTRLGMAFGTPTYMSPEQAAGGKIDARTDLYAVGVLLYELLTGAPPFDADEPGILLRMHILADPPPLPDLVPAPLAAVVMKLLNKEPDERYASATAARRALNASFKLPSKVTGVIGVAGAVPNIATDPAAAPTAAQRLAEAPTGAQDLADTRAEPTPSASEEPELFARSGGTVLAGDSGAVPVPVPVPVPMPMPMMPAPMMSAPAPIAMHPGAAASMSHGASPVPLPMHSGAVPYDPLAVSSTGMPAMGPGLYNSGAYPMSGAHPLPPPTSHARPPRRTGTVIVIVLVLATWIAIGLVWLAGREGARAPTPTPGTSAAPAPGAAKPNPGAAKPNPGAAKPTPGGLYRFADEADSAAPADEPTKKTKRKKKKD